MFFSHQEEVQYNEMITTLQRFQGKMAENVLMPEKDLVGFKSCIFVDLPVLVCSVEFNRCWVCARPPSLPKMFCFFFFNAISTCPSRTIRVWKTTFFLFLLVIMLSVQSEIHGVLSLFFSE